MKYECTVYDRFEGKLHCTVEADSEDGAHDEATSAASERGCTQVTEVVVGIFE